MNNEFKNYYKILGVTQDASENSIRNAVQREYGYANFRQRELIREAEYVLTNFEERRKYDELYNQHVNETERMKQNAVSASDYMSIPKFEIPEIDEEVYEGNATSEELAKETVEVESRVMPTDSTTIETPVSEELPKEPEAEDNIEEKEKEKYTPEQLKELNKFLKENIEEYKNNNPAFNDVDVNNPELFQSLSEELQEIVVNDFNKAKKEEERRKAELDEEIDKELNIKRANRKQVLKNVLIIGGSVLFLGPIAGITAAIILGKKGKLKLQKTASKGIIKEIKTEETKFISESKAALEEQIDTLLKSPLMDNQSRYSLEIAKRKYQNQIDLLEKRIEFKKDQKSELGSKAHNKLSLLALEARLSSSIKFLETRKKLVESKLNLLKKYRPDVTKTDKLTDLYEAIEDVRDEIKNGDLNERQKNRKNIELRKLNAQKINTIKRMALKKNGIARRQLALSMFTNIKNKITGYEPYNESEHEEVFSKSH